MFRKAAREGADVITLNEISKEQAMAIQALPGWDIFWVINDHLPNGNWSGNAVAWRLSAFSFIKGWAKSTEIDYRRGRKVDRRMGPWHKRTVHQACIRLTDKSGFVSPLDVMAFHNPTAFNSNPESRQKCQEAEQEFMDVRIGRKQPAAAGGDGNNVFAKPLKAREGPDGVVSWGELLSEKVLNFKIRGWSDHNGLLVKLRFRA